MTSTMFLPDLRTSEGLVVTPSTIPSLFNSIISFTSAVSIKNFIFAPFAKPNYASKVLLEVQKVE